MMWNLGFLITNALLGVGLAMDAFSVSMANGLSNPCMKKRKGAAIAGVFAAFQAAMPLIGWVCIHTVVQYFTAFEKCIPWIALILLGFIGGKMLYEGFHGGDDEDACGKSLTWGTLFLQGVATSIDALSVGFTIADYDMFAALLAALIIAVVTFVLCFAGVLIGKTFGNKIAGRAQIFGGVILIAIGIEIFISGLI